ncbi:hypothetical protein IAD21_00438 [Abditibacteriota bacterium]|nr:hypothetical protein IAD21_00438 [Abditibacteriota bacterium]
MRGYRRSQSVLFYSIGCGGSPAVFQWLASKKPVANSCLPLLPPYLLC